MGTGACPGGRVGLPGNGPADWLAVGGAEGEVPVAEEEEGDQRMDGALRRQTAAIFCHSDNNNKTITFCE